MKPIDLYISPPSPSCHAVIIAAKYMNINIKIIQIDLMKGEQKEDWFIKMNPQHILPTINDNGFILWESRAIMSYFANKYAPNNPIYPRDPKKRGIVDRFLQYDLNVLARVLPDFLIFRRDSKATSKKFALDIKERKVSEALSYIESVLLNNHYVAGDELTLADFSVYCSLEFADNFNYDFSRFKNIHQYYRRLKQMLNGDHQYQPNTISHHHHQQHHHHQDIITNHQNQIYTTTLIPNNHQEQSTTTTINYQLINNGHFNDRTNTDDDNNNNGGGSTEKNQINNNHQNGTCCFNGDDNSNGAAVSGSSDSCSSSTKFCFR